MKLKLKHKLIGLPVLAAIAPVFAIFIFTSIEEKNVIRKIEAELNLLGRESIEQIALAVYNTCEAASKMVQSILDRKLDNGARFLDSMGALSLSPEVVSRKAINQLTGKEKKVALPRMLVDGLSDPSTYIGLMKKKFRGDYSLFQRMNKQGDMILIATTLAAPGKAPSVGTFLPAVENGTPNPMISNILGKKVYNGVAYVVNGWYFSACKPITDQAGTVIGMLFTGLPYETPESLRQAIIDMKVGKTGYVYVLGGALPFHRGHYIISKGGQRDGENIWTSKDRTGRLYIQSIVKKALRLKKGEAASERYPWRNLGEKTDRSKVVAITYFEPWDWVIGAGAYEDDYYDAKQKMDNSMDQLLWVMVISGLGVLVPVIGIALLIGGRIARPITQITAIAREIARGDLSSAAKSVRSMVGTGRSDSIKVSDSETGHLLSAVKSMTESLNSLVGQVQRSGIQVSSSSTELAATFKQQETTMTKQVESTNKVVKSVEDISHVATTLVDTMQQVASMSQETAGFASSGQEDLARMEETMYNMESASKSISGRLETINEKAENITTVVDTITKVADQTNLLSLNAAIEAEKAGEYGRGFQVVAREIRRLADQTAVATLDIEQMVQEMQSAVSTGVMEMDKFIAEVKRNAEDVGKISAQLTRIIEQVQALSPSFEDVNVSMGQQSENAQEINTAMVNLSEELGQTLESLRETYSAIEQLNEAAGGLQDEVSHFKVDENGLTIED
ncbi:MAG: methyl-accepting chemotaxis protein [Desulfobacteraceae bacterium]|nr:methyl-accepting chemotaxis protein [Desulfobacteraceae bacterium]